MPNHMVQFAKRPGPNAPPTADCFAFAECPEAALPDGAQGQVLVRTLDLSVDPALRCRMNESTGVAYMGPWQVGEVIEGLGGVGVVEQVSEGCTLKTGALVAGSMFWPWAERFVVAEAALQDVGGLVPKGFPPRIVASCLGLIGLTTLHGMEERASIKAGCTFVVSGAAGACGSLAGQMAKIMGAGTVVGICGSAEKCRVLTDELGFNAAVNYKSPTFAGDLASACPRGVDSYFDNVGGDVSDQVIRLMTDDSAIVLCGQISQYNKDVPYPPPLPEATAALVAERRIARERYLVLEYKDKFPQGLATLTEYLLSGQLKVKETVREGLASAGEAFVAMMAGANVGKMLVHVSDL